MKKILLILLAMSTLLALTGCRSSANDMEARSVVNLQKIYDDVDIGGGRIVDIYCDANTNVLYLRDYDHGGITVVYNADGTPKLWSGKVKTQQSFN